MKRRSPVNILVNDSPGRTAVLKWAYEKLSFGFLGQGGAREQSEGCPYGHPEWNGLCSDDETYPHGCGYSLFFVVPHTFIQRKGNLSMGYAELFILAVGLSMDALAVSICKGLSIRSLKLHHTFIVGAWFGAFQALMPAIGYLLGSAFADMIVAVDHWIAFVLLAFIGGNMIRESLSRDEEGYDPSLSVLSMLLLAVATSIDALAVGITFAFLRVDIIPAVTLIGVCTFLISAVGVKIGNVFGERYKSKAELFGGVVLVLIGLKILLEHLELLPF